MRNNAIGAFLICVFLVGMPLAALAQERQGLSSSSEINLLPSIRTMEPVGAGCNLITFEGLGNNTPIGVIPGPVTVTFGSSWLSLVDFDAGGDGNFANEPSPSTSAYYLDQIDVTISLSPPVQHLEFFYSAAAQSLPVVVTAFDAGNAVVDQAVGNTIGTDYDGANCAGDPNGNFCLWDVISLTTATDNIAYITISGTVSNFFGIDNLIFCTEEQPLGACCFRDNSCALLNEQSCQGANGIWTANTPCEQIDCEVLPTEESTWGRIKALFKE